ncbi:MAG: hypothetical protein EOM24_01010 [Chloroflexia bacterium]|nr:hypothetical protein [Chloroflexia bacterium]
MTTDALCPVCTRPYSPNDAICPDCGWELQGGYELVPDPSEVYLRYERDLAQARLAYRERQLQQTQTRLAAQAAQDQARIEVLETTLSREREQTQAQVVALVTELRREQEQARSQVETLLGELRREWAQDRGLLTDAITKAMRTEDQALSPVIFDIYTREYLVRALSVIGDEIKYASSSKLPSNYHYRGAPTVTWAHDGTRLLVANQLGLLFYDVPALIPRTMDLSNISCVALAPDGQSCAVASVGTVRVMLWRIPDRTLLHTLTARAGISHLVFTPDGQYLAMMAEKGVEVWRIGDGTRLHALDHDSSVSTMAFAPDGEYLAIVSPGNVQVLRTSDCQTLYRWR